VTYDFVSTVSLHNRELHARNDDDDDVSLKRNDHTLYGWR